MKRLLAILVVLLMSFQLSLAEEAPFGCVITPAPPAEEEPFPYVYTPDYDEYTPLYVSYLGMTGGIPWSTGLMNGSRYILHRGVSEQRLQDYIKYLQKFGYQISSDTTLTDERTIVFYQNIPDDIIPSFITVIYNPGDESLHIVYPVIYEEKTQKLKNQEKLAYQKETKVIKGGFSDFIMAVDEASVVDSYSIITAQDPNAGAYPIARMNDMLTVQEEKVLEADGGTARLFSVKPKEDVQFVMLHLYMFSEEKTQIIPKRILILLDSLLVNDSLHFGKLKLLDDGTYAIDTRIQTYEAQCEDIWAAVPVLSFQWNAEDVIRKLYVSMDATDGQRLDQMLSFGI